MKTDLAKGWEVEMLLIALRGVSRFYAGDVLAFSLERGRSVAPSKREGLHAETGAVSTVLPTGSDWYDRVSCGGDELIVRQNESPGPRLGDPVWITAEPAPLKVFGADGRALTEVAGTGPRPAPAPPAPRAARHAGRP